ncbi:uncharacterized protein LOC115387345 isoform X2 [Salarias fasciatus]|uniref:uncharacterized protein LOC115387345 isoform X2 n=1 Tax=Salarias fasciatus TaxID=181472 RepID=UPI001176DFBB|nr:uncharacterized protein LOC115387345 isoform X2 [Salarias fasciatus]
MASVWSCAALPHKGNISSPAATMVSVQVLRDFINERLTAAAGEIFTAFQQTIARFDKEIDRQRKLLQIRSNTLQTSNKPLQIRLHRTGSPQQHIGTQEEEHEAPHIKEEEDLVEMTVTDGERDNSHESVRDSTTQRLTAAAVEIIAVFEEAFAQCEKEIDRQHRLLEVIWKPQIKLLRTELPRHQDCREEQLFDQETTCCLEQGEPEPPHVRGKQEESGLLQLKKDQKEPESSQFREKQEQPALLQLRKDQEKPEAPHVKVEQEKSGLPQIKEEQEGAGLSQLKEEPEEPGVLQIKEEHEELELSQIGEYEELGTNQDGEQLQLTFDSDIFKFPSIDQLCEKTWNEVFHKKQTVLPTHPAPLWTQGRPGDPSQGGPPPARASPQVKGQSHRAPGPSLQHKPPGPDPQRPLPSQLKTEPSVTLHPNKGVNIPESNFFETLKPVGVLHGQLLYWFDSAAAPPINTSNPIKRKREQPNKEQQLNEDKPYIKKPPNAFMLFLKEQRPIVSAEIGVKESAVVNAEVGRRAKMEAKLHEEQHPGWSTIENYRKSKARRKAAKAKASTHTGATETPQVHIPGLTDTELYPNQAVRLSPAQPQVFKIEN